MPYFQSVIQIPCFCLIFAIISPHCCAIIKYWFNLRRSCHEKVSYVSRALLVAGVRQCYRISPLHALDESSSFQIARAYKLGLMEDSGANPSGKDYEGKTGLCGKDSDCSEGQVCKGNACTDVCSPNPCSGGYKCIASGHSYTCVQCTADSDCASNKKCSNNICIDACSGNNCASQSKKCTTNSSHGYTCYGCTSDAACPNDQRCDTITSACVSICPSACPGQHCTVSGAHKATCSGCTSDEGCPSGQKCDVEANACVATCTPQKCADENGGTAEDWYIKWYYIDENSTDCECATNKKYVILADVHPDVKYSADKYMRIKAVKDFGNIKKGTLGGYIEKESNLSQTAMLGSDAIRQGATLLKEKPKFMETPLLPVAEERSTTV